MQDDRKFSGHGDPGLLEADAFVKGQALFADDTLIKLLASGSGETKTAKQM